MRALTDLRTILRSTGYMMLAFVPILAFAILVEQASADSAADRDLSGFLSDPGAVELFSMPDLSLSVVDAEGTPLPGEEISLWTQLDFGDGPFDFPVATNHPDCGDSESGHGFFCVIFDADAGVYQPQVMAGSVGDFTLNAYVGYVVDEANYLDTITISIRPPAGSPWEGQSAVAVLDDEGSPISAAGPGQEITLHLTLRDLNGAVITDWATTNLAMSPTLQGAGAQPFAWQNNGDGTYEFTFTVAETGQFSLAFAYLIEAIGQMVPIGATPLTVVPGPVDRFAVVHSQHGAMPNDDFAISIEARNATSLVSFGPNALGDAYEVIVDVDGVVEGVGLGNVTLDFTEADGGVAQHTLQFPAVGNGKVITVTSASDGAIVGTSGPINVAIGPAAGGPSTIAPPAEASAVGDAAVFTVALRDMAGNAVANSAASISFYLNDLGDSLSASSGDGGNLTEVAPGVYEFEYVHSAPGAYFISAYIGANHGEWAGLGDPIGEAATVAAPGVLHSFRVRELGQPDSGTTDQLAGVPFTIELEALDASGARLASGPNLLTGAIQVDLALESGSGGTGIGGAVSLNFTAGLATREITLSTLVGTEEIIATRTGQPSITGSTDAFAVHPGVLAAFRFEFADGTPFEDVPPRTAGDLHSLRLRAVDTFGNTLNAGPSTFTGTVMLTSNAAGIAPVGLGVTPPFVAGILTLDVGAPDRRIAFTEARLGARFTAQQIGGAAVTSNSETFTVVSDGIISAGESLMTAPTSALVGSPVIVTLTLRDQFQNVITAPQDVTLAFNDDAEALIAAGDQGDGTYTASFTRLLAASIAVSAYLGEDDQGTLLGQVTVVFTSAPLPGSPPAPQTGEVQLIDVNGTNGVPVPQLDSSPVLPDATTVVQQTSEGGRSVHVTLPSQNIQGASSATSATGLSLEVGFVEDLGASSLEAPSPAAGQVVAQFVARLVDADGVMHRGSFDPPVTIEFTVPVTDPLASIDGDDLVLVYWNGSEWVEVTATVVRTNEGITLRAQVTHFTLFSVLEVGPQWGTLETISSIGPLRVARWMGGTYERLGRAAPNSVVWAHVAERWFVYRHGAPPFLNHQFFRVFPDGLGAGTPVVLWGQAG